ncbi:hypothetical protein OIU74_006194 [Salix koriyanagi]|uniref:Uncharacterized protein n=1 Tax=Salix koriyanagi TaxID=2511006 RepID=A0A9Q0UDI5_9ROSI|nr:hypothetical protein OIU74_006194 [Salix koriyanagi]
MILIDPRCRDRLVLALGLDLFAVNDEKFMDMFVAPGAIDVLQNERQSLQKRQKILQSCLNDFVFLAIWKPFIPVKLGEDGRVNALLEWSACEAEP